MTTRSSWRKRLTVAGVVALALVGVVLAFRPSPQPVDVVVVARRPLVVTVDQEGVSRVRDRYVITAPVAGGLHRIGLEAGDSVRRGQVVALLDPLALDSRSRQLATARLAAAEDTYRTARANLEAAREVYAQTHRERVRADSLAAQHLISPEQQEQFAVSESSRAREVDAADYKAQAAAHDVEQARAALSPGGTGAASPYAVYAPVSGRVLRIPERSGRVVAAGDTLLVVGDPARIEIVADLLSSDAVKVHPGDTMLLEEWGGGDTLRGVIRRVEPAGFTKVSALGVEEQRVNVIGDLVEPAGGLGDAYRVEVRVVLWRGEDVVTVPASAIYRSAGGWETFVVESGRARRRVLTIGHRGAFDVEVVSGLSPGEVVIRQPSDRITDGIRVRPTRPAS
jgi:HlyD family secretion protein